MKNDPRIKPERVLIDHCEEHTIRMARDAGFWAGLTIYPVSKVTPARGVDILEQYGPIKDDLRQQRQRLGRIGADQP